MRREAASTPKGHPGPSAAVSALALSGLDTGKFVFEDFSAAGKRAQRAAGGIKARAATIIFYEAPHKLCDTECDVSGAGRAQKITLARGLTKVYEEVIRTTLSQAVELYTQRDRAAVCAGGAGCQGGAEA